MSQIKAQPANLNCPSCDSSETIKIGSPKQREHGIVQPCRCKECGKQFTLGSKKVKAQPANLNCPSCDSFETIKIASPKQRKHGIIQQCQCKKCGKHFTLGSKKVKAQPADVDCPQCGSSKTVKEGRPQKREHGIVQPCTCKECGKYFTLGSKQVKAQPADVNCPHCDSSETIKKESPKQRKHGIIQQCQCKKCGKHFTLGSKKTKMQPLDVDCPQCGSSKIVKKGRPQKREHGIVQPCTCKECGKNFTLGSKKVKAQPADVNCPQCGSSKTVKEGRPQKREHGIVQRCRCKECGKQFTLGGRKSEQVVLGSKVIHTFWNVAELQVLDNIACPNCSKKKAILKTKYYDNTMQKNVNKMLCLGCGQIFRGEGRVWKNHISRRLGKTIPCQPWRFEEDKWDLRNIYPNIDEYKFKSLFINFSNCGSHWFKNLLKSYCVWLIKTISASPRTIADKLSVLGCLGRFLERQEVICIEQLNRKLLATYYNQERGHLNAKSLYSQMNIMKLFLQWGKETQHFTTSPILITSFDYPKVFQEEPDPLEDAVIEAIRDNLHILPEPLQLMFILGFWLGTRPGELCHIRKDCLKLDPEGTIWWLEFERQKSSDEHRLPIPTDIVRLIQQQQTYINQLFDHDYPFLFCHYQNLGITSYPNFPRMKAIKRPPMVNSSTNPMVKAIQCLIEKCNIQDTNGKLVRFTGNILRPSRATHLINNGFSLDFIRIWLKHRNAITTKKHYTRYKPGQLLDVATVMANVDQKFYAYDSNPESLRQNPELHELDGLKMLNGEPLYGYCSFREFCPRFGRCYTCGFHVASADKIFHYKSQLERLKTKEQLAFNHGSSEIFESYQQLVNALESIIEALEGVDEGETEAANSP